MTALLPWVSLVMVAASLVVSLAAYLRADRWRDGEDAARLLTRVTATEQAIHGLQTRMEAVATKEDLAGLKAEVRALGTDIRNTERGVERIESYLMRGSGS